jgi:lipopolysaccharide/colanic/teichoic acid biosynthesis glycosyltransferase
LLAKVEDPIAYNNEVIYPDKVRLNRYYYHHYSFVMDLRMIFATVLGKKILYNNEWI